MPGVVLLSTLSDRLDITLVYLISALGSTLSIFLVWGISSSIASLAVFAVCYGFFAGGFTATYAGTVRELRRQAPAADLGSIVGMLSLGRGIGNVVCGPLSELLLGGGSTSSTVDASGGGPYRSRYGPLIVFTGVTAAVTMSPWFLRKLKLM